MARIRTIKPEFPQSESMGRVSRDARLTFIMLWTLADDSGRLRGNSRMLASLLFPYDSDAFERIDGWLSELDSEGCIGRYKVGSDAYIEILNWLTHQKIDKPSQSKIPAFDESSRILSNPLESSSEDQGSRKGSKDQGRDQSPLPPQGEAAPSAPLLPKPKRRNPASLDIIKKDSDRLAFQALWDEWPREREGKPARGEKPKAQTCFQSILHGGEVSSEELLQAARIYISEDARVKAGYPKMVSSWLALKDGFWKQCVQTVRARSVEAI